VHPSAFDALVLKVFQPISTAGKAPVTTTASKAPAKPTEKTTDQVSHLLTSHMSREDAESDEDGRLGIEAIA
jgi:hypothetical protein